MIQLHDIRYSVGQRVLFEHLDWVISPGDRCALVGPNGTGKTTLIKLILGEIAPDTGERVLARGSRLGYLPQEAAERFDGTVLDRALEAHRHVLEMRAELDALHERLSTVAHDDPHLEALLERTGELQHHLDHHDEHALVPEARRVLSGLGFSETDQDRPLAEFSGGWRMRAALAALLLTDPTLLFLDEPTNHLDLPAMEWLEDYLEDFRGGLVVVSHDRVFLDRVATEVRELDDGALSEYPMTFTRYLEEKEVRRGQMEAQNQQLDQKIAQLERFVQRFGAKNTKASQAASKKKQIDRLKTERVVVPRRARSIRFHFPTPPHAGRTLIQLRDAAFAYEGGPDIFSGVNLAIERGDKLAIVGANGAGKTTLLRVIAGQLAITAGAREITPLTKSSYFAQHAAETLDGDATVLGALEDSAPMDWRPRIRSLLGNFLFTGDDVFKLCRVLSGGERQRVAIARMLMESVNLVLLDEPTHHLDLAGKEVLEDALGQYPGAIVVVTHDRSLMAKLASRVVEVDHGRARLYPGGYDDYESSRLASKAAATAPPPAKVPVAGAEANRPRLSSGGKVAAGAGVAAKPAVSREEQRRAQNEQRKRERETARLEKEIETREARMKELEASLADPDLYHDATRSRDLVLEYERLRAETEAMWQRLGELG